MLAVDLPGHGNSPARRPSGCQASPYFRCAAWKVRTLAPPLLLPRRRRTDVSPPVRAMTLAADAVVRTVAGHHGHGGGGAHKGGPTKWPGPSRGNEPEPSSPGQPTPPPTPPNTSMASAHQLARLV
ncbi:MAG: hypothetical protein QOJ06_1201 [Pseudonocardiales bacterium]|nr:hypothetical protein [Pseudonocardiales bacterium]